MTRIPVVKLCDMTECGFNDDQKCHAAGIMVGDPPSFAAARSGTALQDPRCDTFTPQPGGHFGARDLSGQVGACMANHCQYNDALRCTAEEIVVGHHESHADCKTFQLRRS